MAKNADGKTFGCPKLTRIEKLTKGLLQSSNEESTFVVKEGRVFLETALIRKDSFVMEYSGDIISEAEATERVMNYESSGENFSILYFRYQEINLAMDASQTKSFARFLGHSTCPNIRFYRPFIVDLNSVLPKIAAYALRDIHQGEEIVVDYRIQDGSCEDVSAGASSDSQEISELSSKISIVGNCYTEPLAAKGLSNVNTTVSFSAGNRAGRGKRKATRKGEFAYSFINLAPEGFKRSLFAAYQNIGIPDRIMQVPDCSWNKQLLGWFDNMCSDLDATIEYGKAFGVSSVPQRDNLSKSYYAGQNSSVIVPPKKDVKNNSKRHSALSNSLYASVERNALSLNDPLLENSTRYGKKGPPCVIVKGIASNRCNVAVQRVDTFLNRNDGQHEAVSTDLLTSVNLMDTDRYSLANHSSDSHLEKASRSVACSGVRNWKKRIIDETSADDVLGGRTKSFVLKEYTILEEHCAKTILSKKCEVVLSEMTNSLNKSGELTRNMLSHVANRHASSSRTTPVAVVKGIVSKEG